MALTATFTGCSLVSSNNEADMKQEIATVDITKSDKFEESGLKDYATAVKASSIVKRDLVSYFLNVGYSYIQNGQSYEDTFNMLLDALVNNSAITQYSVLYLLKDKSTNQSSKVEYDPSALSTFLSYEDEVEQYEYLLGGAKSDNVLLAKYSLYSSLNSAIDRYEKTIIDSEDGFTGTDSRTTPANVDTEQDDYYPQDENGKLDYYVYTGYQGYLLSDSGKYQDDAIEGTTRATRLKAYNQFINSLKNNYFIDESDSENLTDLMKLKYIKQEYVSQLKSRVMNVYYEIYEDEMEEKLLLNNYIGKVYQELLESQRKSNKLSSSFETAMGSYSDSSFLLYSPDTSDSDKFDGTNYGKFGYVYNILLPFNAKQTRALNELKSSLEKDGDDDSYYIERNKLLRAIKTEDQRGAWFNGTNDYSFKVSDSDYNKGYYSHTDNDYLFFEGNLTDSGEGGRYKALKLYDGRYSYNGNVYENEDGSYTLIGEKLDIDQMLDEFVSYINYVLTGDKNGGRVSLEYYRGSKDEYYGISNFYKTPSQGEEQDKNKEIDYSNFLYAYGKVEGISDSFSRKDFLKSEEPLDQYKAMSAVNELQYAYTTDTGVLSQYVGYSVSAYDTNYIKEFEYAAKFAINKGVGSYSVCAGDYGWHIIYVTNVFDAGDTYANEQLDWANNVKVEGTFENLFFEWLKGNNLTDLTTSQQNKIINDFVKEDVTVIKYQSRYQDLLNLG